MLVACGKKGLLLFNITNPRKPKKISSIVTTNAKHLQLSNDEKFVYIADSEGGLKIIDINDLENPKFYS